jgi:hypothetical protein
MNRARQTTFEIVAHAAWMFAAWAAARIALAIYMRRDVNYLDALVGIASDVEIHSLRFRWGWDLAVFVLFAAAVAVVQKLRRQAVLVSTISSTLLAAGLSIGMVVYPALTLSGRMSSPFTGVDRSINESIAFAVVVTLTLVSVVVLLSRAHRDKPSTEPPARA